MSTLTLLTVAGLVFLAFISGAAICKSRAARWTCCIIALLLNVLFLFGIYTLMDMEHNSHYSSATKELIEISILTLETDRSDELLAELKKLESKLTSTYESKGNFDELAREAAKNLTDPK